MRVQAQNHVPTRTCGAGCISLIAHVSLLIMSQLRRAVGVSFAIVNLAALLGCSGTGSEPPVAEATAGASAAGPSSSAGSGSSVLASGGATASGGAPNTGSSGAASGGIDSNGGVGTGGATAGATNQGGSSANAGASAAGVGNTASGGAASGGTASGGTASAGSGGTVALDAGLLTKCTGTNPILCTLPVPSDGNYTVTVELGSASAASTSRVQAETYRIVVPPTSLTAGSFSQQTFSVNVRAEKHDGYSAPGKTLNLRIDGTAPALHGVGVLATPNIPTVFVAGDSTVCDWDPVYTAANANTAGPLERGWAQELSQFLKPGIAVANYADSGETAVSFRSGFWAPAKALLRAGDYVFIQFGHNDQKSNVAGFTASMMSYITDARNANAIPVLFTPPGRKSASTADTGFAGLDKQTRDLASAQNVALVDLTNLSINYYRTLPDKSVVFANPTEGTHFSETGATALSSLVVTSLKTSTLALKAFIR